MKQALVFYPQLDKPLSGGQVIDFSFIDQINESGIFNVSYLLDADLKSSSILYYNYYMISHLRRFYKYDVIFINSRYYPRLLLLVLLLRLFFFKGKIITYHHHYNYQVNNGARRVIHRFLEILFLKSMTKVIVPSPYTLKITQSFLKNSKIKYIEIGFDTKIKENKCNKPLKWLFVGTVEARKGVEYLVDVAKILKERGCDIEIHVIGSLSDTNYVENLREGIKSNGLERNVLLLGRIDSDTLTNEYETSYGFIFPSLHEGYGMVLIEAMSYGLPVVAFNNSAMPFTVKNNYNGLLIENQNAMLMADAIELLVHNKSLYNVFQINAYEYVKTIKTNEKMRDEMKRFIESL